MHNVNHDIFRAIHEGKWLKIEYRNKQDGITKYWIGIKDINVKKRSLSVDGLHVGKYTVCKLDCIYIDSIISSQIIDGSYCEINQNLVNDIYLYPNKYACIFDNTINLKILTYLEKCYMQDTTPYEDNFELIKHIDNDSFDGNCYKLNDEQFRNIIKYFQYKIINKNDLNNVISMKRLAMNVLSIHTNKGLYVLAYRKLKLDVKEKTLVPSANITICKEYIMDGAKESIRKFLDADNYELLDNFEANSEKIKDLVAKHSRTVMGVDDVPYIIGLGIDIMLDLHSEYKSIIKMYNDGNVTVPIRAFFGELNNRPIRRKEYPITLINENINLDQLLAISKGMKYPLTYVQGPPGTGKTNTIINTLVTAFFNDRTVLFTSYNNRPIDGVYEKLSSMTYNDKKIYFPILRIGNKINMQNAIVYLRNIYYATKDIKATDIDLAINKGQRTKKAKALSKFLREYDVLLELKERRDTLKKMIEHQENSYSNGMGMLTLYTDLYGNQLRKVNKQIEKAKEISEEDVLSLVDTDYEQLYEYLYSISLKMMKRLHTPEFAPLMNIILNMDEENTTINDVSDKQVSAFTTYLKDTDNIKRLQKVFPIIITTCISASKIGEPKPMFDMVIMDEASQCNTAVSLVPIIRGQSLMLVGDPQQLSPVIVLNEAINEQLRLKYNISDEYDYCKNSIYKVFLACDAVSDEILLHNHYRCNKKIIDFNNKKYYNSRLNVYSNSLENDPLVYVNIENSIPYVRNTSPREVEAVIEYASIHKDKTIGVVTPFANQKKMIEHELEKSGLKNVQCGTVHTFQGDEKDIVLFSTALTSQTKQGTYDWLKNNKELINVATSRAKDKLIILADYANLSRLHGKAPEDDLYELINYVRKNGKSEVSSKKTYSRALGVKPFSTATEEAFLTSLTHALENIWLNNNSFTIKKEVPISQVFMNNIGYNDLFYTGRFDFVVYQRVGEEDLPVLAIELDGKEHYENEIVMARDRKKNELCREHNLQLIRVESSYARRYNHIKMILTNFFSRKH